MEAERIECEAKLLRARREITMLGEEVLDQRANEPDLAYWDDIVLLAEVLSSTSWRITAPLRVFTTFLRAARTRDWAAFRDWRATMRGLKRHVSSPPAGPVRRTLSEPTELPIPGRAGSDSPRLTGSGGRLLIAFVSGLPGTPSETYRVSHPMHILGQSFETFAVEEADVALHRARLVAARVLVLFRANLDDQLFDLIAEAKANGCIVIYDVDDLVFDPVIVSARFMDTIRSFDRRSLLNYRERIARTRRLMRAADVCTVSTAYLAEKVAEIVGTPALVLPNGLTEAMLERFEQARSLRRPAADGKLRIGYASGTKTHQRDFAAAKDAILAILKARDDVILTVIGSLDLGEYPEFDEVNSKIERRPLVPLDKLPLELIRIDINIAPLELGNPFAEAKSELKYFDAALLEIPTVATPIAGYSAVIRSGINGYLATTPEEWRRCIEGLLDDAARRREIGQEARARALTRFGPYSIEDNTNELYRKIIDYQFNSIGNNTNHLISL